MPPRFTVDVSDVCPVMVGKIRFNATGNEVAIETLEIAHEGIVKDDSTTHNDSAPKYCTYTLFGQTITAKC